MQLVVGPTQCCSVLTRSIPRLCKQVLGVLTCRFEEACAAYTEGGRPELGLALLQQLADNAVLQCRFADAAHGYYKLAMESLKVSTVLRGNVCCGGGVAPCCAARGCFQWMCAVALAT